MLSCVSANLKSPETKEVETEEEETEPESERETEPETETEIESAKRTATVLGWLTGGALGVLANYLLYHSLDDYPVTPTSFVLFIVGAFGGMALADRLGPKAIPTLGALLGLVLGAGLLAAILLTG